MKKFFYVASALLLTLSSCTEVLQESELMTPAEQNLKAKLVGKTTDEADPGTLLVKLNEELSGKIAEGDMTAMLSLLEVSGADAIVPALPIQPKNMEVARKYGLHRWFSLSFDENIPVREVAEKIASVPAVTSVQFDSYITPILSDKVVAISPELMTRTSPVPLPEEGFNDPHLGLQWNLINNGDLSVTDDIRVKAVAGADVGVKDAWRLTGGDPSVVVAVFDCAVNSLHEDLRNALWVNEAEANGQLNVDDDGNGFIDDEYGFNFVGCTKINKDYMNNVLDGKEVEAVKGNRLNWTDGSGHGTHVAGIIGAVNNNGKGVSSIAGGTGNGDGVRLMSCQIFQGTRNASDSQNAAAFIYAADNGACIAQCSYGSSSVITSDSDYINGNEELGVDGSPLENAALKYFLDPANSNHESLEGNIAIFAAGNHKNPYSSYPGALPYVVSVTAFGIDHLPGGYTNYGPGSKISAPGGEYTDEHNYGTMILSTGVSNAAQSSPGLDGKNYVYMQGTSMACPHVSGVVALGISYAKKLNKKFTREEFTSLLLSSTNDIDQYLDGTKRYYDLSSYSWTDVELGKYKGQLGAGAVDAWKFLMAIEGTPSVLVQAGTKARINLDQYYNSGTAYEITIDEASRTSLGLVSDPVINGGYLELECSKIGAGKVTLSSSVGKDPQKEDGIGGMDYSREISIVSRPFATSNGGWL